MCSRVTCRQCGKFTWSGCGQHIESALAGIPKSQICEGHDEQPKASGIFSKLFRK